MGSSTSSTAVTGAASRGGHRDHVGIERPVGFVAGQGGQTLHLGAGGNHHDVHLAGLLDRCGGCLGHPGESLETVLHRADQALYAAKAEGRNRVWIAGAAMRVAAAPAA